MILFKTAKKLSTLRYIHVAFLCSSNNLFVLIGRLCLNILLLSPPSLYIQPCKVRAFAIKDQTTTAFEIKFEDSVVTRDKLLESLKWPIYTCSVIYRHWKMNLYNTIQSPKVALLCCIMGRPLNGESFVQNWSIKNSETPKSYLFTLARSYCDDKSMAPFIFICTKTHNSGCDWFKTLKCTTLQTGPRVTN